MVECPGCGYEFEPEDDCAMMGIEDASAAILNYYKPDFNLDDRIVLEDAIKKCLSERLGVSPGKL